MRLGHFDLNLFVTLDALLDTRSVSRAGERLHIGASATSSALARLREHFGDELLVQVGRRMELTPLAQNLREPVRDLLLRSQATLAAKADFDATREQRRFVFNASDYATTVLLTPLAQRLETEAPGISMDVVSLGDSNLQRLERGEVDFALYPERNASDQHPMQQLMSESYTCVVWTGHRLPAQGLSFEHYMASRHVAAQFGDQRVATFESWFLSTHGVAREVVVTASTFNSLPPLVVGTQRIATMHTRLARMYARILPIRLLPPPFEIPPLHLVMQWNRHNTQDAAHAWLRQQLIAVAQDAA
ncbi:LysR family transcriptional regulator [Sphaerotilus hippei]|uniref:LysR family transcriptional regulator n=1 Tax=Sphaerotilus hippei TaxID=744406 RepID=A0A318H2Q6_9BURK|nr:LysR family transcriptional regulator [Sphaerotilus hippei]PXW97517.1 LysR family transcriptional regulator [Sphaerotilus hippei]